MTRNENKEKRGKIMEISFSDADHDKIMTISEDAYKIKFMIQDAYDDEEFLSFDIKRSQIKYLLSSIAILQSFAHEQHV